MGEIFMGDMHIKLENILNIGYQSHDISFSTAEGISKDLAYCINSVL